MNKSGRGGKRIPFGRYLDFYNRLGPGLLLAATSIGASHLVMSPKAGSTFGFQLLWLVTLTHVFKYHAFESGPRYAAATGESLIAGYMRMPGPRGWALWIFLLGTAAQGIGVLAGVVSIAAAVLHSFIGGMTFTHYTALVIVTVLLFLRFGGYGWLDMLNKLMMIALFVATLVVFLPVFPHPRVFTHFFLPTLPAGSIVLVAAVLGWMPTGIDVSIWHSLWTLEKHPLLSSTVDDDRGAKREEVLRFSLTDMRIGYLLSFLVASVFLLLAALFLHGTSRGIDGVEFAKSLAFIYTERLGGWVFYVFMIAAFFAMYSTSYTVMDGFPRSFAETLATLFPGLRNRWWDRFYWGFIFFAAVFAFIIVVTVGNPVTLVMMVAVLSLCVAPLYYGLNYYCVTRFIRDERFRLSAAGRFVAPVGIVIMTISALICVLAKLEMLK